MAHPIVDAEGPALVTVTRPEPPPACASRSPLGHSTCKNPKTRHEHKPGEPVLEISPPREGWVR
jgi:hypothetical protein